MYRSWHLQCCRRAVAWNFLLAILIFLCAEQATAQSPPASPPSGPVQRIFGVGDDEFFKAAWIKIRPDTAGAPDSTVWTKARELWEVADKLGIDILRIQGRDFIDQGLIDSMISQRTDTVGARTRQRLMTANIGANFEKASVGREVLFYPFTGRDSVEYRYWPTKFRTMAGGTSVQSPFGAETDVYGQRAWEQHYRRGSTNGNTVIASDIDFGTFPARQYRWPRYDTNGTEKQDDSVHNSEEFLVDRWQLNKAATTQFVVVTGHLFDDTTATAQAGDTLLKIEVIYEIPRNRKYVSDVTTTPKVITTATSNIERNLKTFYITKAQLYPVGTPPVFTAYREIALAFDARWCSDFTNGQLNTGPLYPGNDSRRINLKVTWTRKEDVAIRSIGLRDSIGQIMLGKTDTAGHAALFAAALLDVRRMVTINDSDTGSAVWPIIAVAPHIESYPMHTRAFNRMTRFIQDRVPAFDVRNNANDSITVWNETDYNESLFQRWKQSANPELLVPNAVVPETSIKTHLWLDRRLKLRDGRIPSIRAHNGFRF